MALRSGTEPLLDDEAFTELGALYREPLWLVNRLASLLEVISREAPIVIVVDDADLSDDLTRYAIRTLSGRLAGSPVLWLLAGRDPGELELVGLVGGARRSRAEHIRLAPLGAASMEELLVEQLGQPDAEVSGLLDKVGGNPFWARRVLDGYASDRSTELGGVPAQFVESVRQRLLSLAPPAFALVQAAAVWNQRVGVDEAAELLGNSDSGGVMRSLAGAVDVGLLAESRTGFWFPHELVRQAVYLDVPPSSRRSLHRAFGRHLLAGGHRSDHRSRALRRQRRARRSRVCRGPACSGGVGSEPHTAADLLAQAWELTPSDHPRWIEIGEACLATTSQAGRGRAASSIAAELLDADRLDPDTTARLQVLAAQADWLTGRVDDTAARLATVLDDPSTGRAPKARAAAAQALTLTELGRMDEAVAAAHGALSVGPTDPDPSTASDALRALGRAESSEGRFEDALGLFRAAHEATPHADRTDEILALQMLGRFDVADTLLGTPAVGATDAAMAYARLLQSLHLGRFDEARTDAQASLVQNDEHGSHARSLETWAILSVLALDQGGTDEADAALVQARSHLRNDDRRAGGLTLLDALISEQRGDLDRSVRLLLPLVSGPGRVATPPSWLLDALPRVTRIGVAAGNTDLAGSTTRIARTIADQNPNADQPAALALQCAGLSAGDPGALKEAVELHSETGPPMLRAHAIADHGAALIRAGDTPSARSRWTRRSLLYRDLGAEHDAATTREVLRRAGVKPRRRKR